MSTAGSAAILPGSGPGRDRRADILKGLSILAVVAIHAGTPASPILRFCVPVFVGLWAYFLERSLSRRSPADGWKYAAERFRQLAIVYMVWTVFYLSLWHTWSEWQTTRITTIVGGWWGGYGWPGQYFFLILFQGLLIVPLVRRSLTVHNAAWWLLLGMLLSSSGNLAAWYWPVLKKLGERLGIYWIGYVVAGIGLARGYWRPQHALLPWAVLTLLFAPLETAAYASAGIHPSAYLLLTVTLGSIGLLLGCGPARDDPPSSQRQQDRPFPCATTVLQSPGESPAVPSQGPARASAMYRLFEILGVGLAWIGQRSLGIFVSHFAMLDLVTRQLPSSWLPTQDVARTGLLVLIAVAGSLAIMTVLRRIGAGWMIGESRH